MRDELIHDLDMVENIMIRLAEERQMKRYRMGKEGVILCNLLWWLAKAIYDIIKYILRGERKNV